LQAVAVIHTNGSRYTLSSASSHPIGAKSTLCASAGCRCQPSTVESDVVRRSS
jgi:hypothetical protein